MFKDKQQNVKIVTSICQKTKSYQMKKNKVKNAKYKGAEGRLSLIDLAIPESYSGKLILFVHGFMGFKDWGAWQLTEEYFLNLGFAFCKYNVSHNGCSTTQPTDFVDLNAFSKNNYSKEKTDLNLVLNWLSEQMKPLPEIYVIGHSRGGGVVLLSNQDTRIKKIATWAAISDIGKRFPVGEGLEKWKTDGVRYQKNGRTNQEMPLYFSQYEDFVEYQHELNIKSSIQSITKPLLLIHGNADTSVSISEGEELSLWSGVSLNTIEGANHTFGGSHPWKEKSMPSDLQKVCKLTAEFFLSSLK